jgi:hypothetical protein
MLRAVDVGLLYDFRVRVDVVKGRDVEAVSRFGQRGHSGFGQAQVWLGKISAHEGQRSVVASSHGEEGVELVLAPLFGPASKHQRHVDAAPEQSFDHSASNQASPTGHKRMVRRAHRTRR